MPRKGGQRPLDPGEKSLWHSVTETVEPLPGAPLPPAPVPAKTSSSPSSGTRRKALKASATAPTPQHPAPRIDGGDPKMAKRVARGRLDIDATLDLHGYSQASAETRLQRFIEFAVLRGDRVLLVITGKGTPGHVEHRPFGDAPRGILRKRFLEWVEMPPLRGRIASVRQSHQRHGGRGAFYIFLKSPSRRTTNKVS